jgi:sigma-B regulation protein RsbU (phosphoserine phosphatase)
MLSTILTLQRRQFNSLAKAWLTAGATTFSVWENGHPIAHWPDGVQTEETDLTAVILVGEMILGEIRVTGLNGPEAQARLIAEADLIAQLTKLNDELDGMTAELIESQDQLLALYNLSQVTRAHLNLDQILHSITQELVRLVKAEGAFTMVNSSNAPIFTEQYPVSLFAEPTLQHFFRMVQSEQGEVLLPADKIPSSLPPGVINLFLKSISIRDNLTAMIGVLFSQPITSLSPNLKLARAITEHAGGQIENAFLHQETVAQAKLKTELELAARIQLHLLPQSIPKVCELDIATGSRPALQVGGDFYDFIVQPEAPFTFTIGDISGKGVSAAILMAMTRIVIRSKARFLPTPRPKIILERSNEDMYDDFTEVGMLATVFIGQYHPTKRELYFANAGHSPVIYCPVNGKAHLLEADGPAMGVLPTSLSEDQALSFNPGDVFIVATDGFNEARNAAGEMFGYDRLLHLVEIAADLSAEAIADTLFAAITDFAGDHPQDDDQTLVVIKGIEA